MNSYIHYLPLALWLQSQNRQLPRDLIEKLLLEMPAANPKVQSTIVRVLAIGPVELCLPPLISYLAGPAEDVAQNILSNIRSWLPWTISRPWQTAINPQTVLDDAIWSFFSQQRSLEAASVNRLLSRLSTLCGAESEIARALASFDKKIAKEFEILLQTKANINHPPQITLVPTYRCNANCSYCYASIHRSALAPLLTMELFKQVLNHAVQLGYRRMGFTGGEPTLHPQFKEFISAVRDRGLSLFFATNGTFQAELIDHLDPSLTGTITVHLWFKPYSGHPAEQCFVKNIRLLCDRGFRMAIRYTIHDGIPVPVDSITTVSQTMGLRQVSLALSVPRSAHERSLVSFDHLVKESRRLLDAAKQFVRNGLMVAFAKPLPFCTIGLEDLRWFARSPYNVGTCPVWRVGGTHNLLVNYNGDLWPCIVLSQSLGQFLSYRCRKEIEDRSNSIIQALANQPLFEICHNCELWYLRRCQGACLAYKNG